MMGQYDRDRIGGTVGTVVRQTILLTGALSVLPLLPYPNTFGMGMLGAGPWLCLVEGLLYLGFLSIFARWMTSLQLVAGAVFTVIYRVLLGTFCGSLIAISHNGSWWQSVNIILWSYPFAVIIHFVSAPLVILSVLVEFWGEGVRGVRRKVARPAESWGQRGMEAPHRLETTPRIVQAAMPLRSTPHHIPDLQDALAYTGEYDGVRMCWIVDQEGLPLATWQRQDYSASTDFWAPISVEMVELNRRCISVGGDIRPVRIEVRTDAGRILLETAGDYWLGVLTDRDTDELIGLRLSQSREMILKHLQERRAQYTGLQEARYV